MTDEHAVYGNMIKMLPHDVIRHESEYVRGEIHTQNIESFWALLKRGHVPPRRRGISGAICERI